MDTEGNFQQLFPRKTNDQKKVSFSTPVKSRPIFDHRNTEIQKTPKGKVSKSKLMSKIAQNKSVIDFDVSQFPDYDDGNSNTFNNYQNNNNNNQFGYDDEDTQKPFYFQNNNSNFNNNNSNNTLLNLINGSSSGNIFSQQNNINFNKLQSFDQQINNNHNTGNMMNGGGGIFSQQNHLQVPYNNEFEQNLQTPQNKWLCDSPSKTIRKASRFSTAATFNEISGYFNNSNGQSNFQKLLNESDQCSVQNYQLLSGANELDENYESLRDRVSYEMEGGKEQNFFSTHFMDPVDNTIEIIGEEKIHPLDVTLNALANVFTQFDYEPNSFEFEFKFAQGDNDNEIIISTNGKLISQDFKPDFIMSAKILLDTNVFKHIKLKIC